MTYARQTCIINSKKDISAMEFAPSGRYLRAETGIVRRSWTDETSPAVEAEIVPTNGGVFFFRYRINTYDAEWVSSYGHYKTADDAIADCREAILDELETMVKGR